MRRASTKKASTFKLQAARTKYQNYLEDIDTCTVAKRFPTMIDTIKSTSQALFDICYSFREDSPFNRGLNYDNRYFGFHKSDKIITYSEYLGEINQAFLLGDFNGFNQQKHKLVSNEDFGQGWFKLQWDLNEFRLDENSRLQLKIIDRKGQQWLGAPPSCRVVQGQFGYYRKQPLKTYQTSKHKISQLLAYTIDLEQISLQKCVKFIEQQSQILGCFNIIILKNLFSQKRSLIHKFSLTRQKADILQDIIQRLTLLGLKVAVQWNFNPAQMTEPKGAEELYGRECGACQWQFDLSKNSAIAFYLSFIAYYFRQFGVRGLHFTKVHRLINVNNGVLVVKIINLLCQRLGEDAMTLASSKQFIPGLSQNIQQGGLGFSFTFNFHECLSLDRQHESIYEVVKQIQSSSNCLALNLNSIQPEDYIYLLFTFMISKKGIFTQGPILNLRQELIKILKLRKQEELFSQQAEVSKINEQCVTINRGEITIYFNFGKDQCKIQGDYQHRKVLFSQMEESENVCLDNLIMKGFDCLVLQKC